MPYHPIHTTPGGCRHRLERLVMVAGELCGGLLLLEFAVEFVEVIEKRRKLAPGGVCKSLA
jgi:hypothetical protein